MKTDNSKGLKRYDLPEDLKTMTIEEMELLAVEIRDFLITSISKTGGHLASNLGVVELSIALHRCFDSPEDKIIWDVGHQSYVHKILTGRADGFDHLRELGGMSGFPKKSESPHDIYDSGHSSTSISIAAGLAAARDRQCQDYDAVAVIGDGALTGGIAWEALNNLGDSGSKAIVILNDNGMSIRKNTGGVSNHLSKLRVSKKYYSLKKKVTDAVDSIPTVGDSIHKGMSKVRDSLKYALVDGVIFEELGFTYIGPVNGHDIQALLDAMKLAKAADGPVMLHVITKKGKGYINAEKHPGRFHGTGPFDPVTGEILSVSEIPTYSRIFGSKLVELAKKDDKLVAVTAAMTDGTGLGKFAELFPLRIYDVGIAEAHAVTFAAGLATGGMHPVVAVYSTFLQRAYDEILMDICLQKLPVILAIDRAGNVGADGETHHGMFDISYLSHMPGMNVMSPRDGSELSAMLEYAHSLGKPCAIRYPRGKNGDIDLPRKPLDGTAEVLKEGADAEIWALGSMVRPALRASEILEKSGMSIGVVNARYASPLDNDGLRASAARCRMLITAEDNALAGGFGEKTAAAVNEMGLATPVHNLGWPDEFIEHGQCEQLYAKYGLDADGIAEGVRHYVR